MNVKELIAELRKQDPDAIVENCDCKEFTRVVKMLNRRRHRTEPGRRSDPVVHLEWGEKL